MAEPQAQWAKAFVAAQSEMPEIPKTKKATIPTKSGGGYEYSYADLPAIIDAVRPVLSKHGLAFAQSVETTESAIAITTIVYHEAGGSQSFGPLLLPGGSDARGAGSAITYGRRYALCAALGIAADEDDDAATAVKKQAPAQQPAQAAQPKRPPVIDEILAHGFTMGQIVKAARKVAEKYGKQLSRIEDAYNAPAEFWGDIAIVLRESKAAQNGSEPAPAPDAQQPAPVAPAPTTSAEADALEDTGGLPAEHCTQHETYNVDCPACKGAAIAASSRKATV